MKKKQNIQKIGLALAMASVVYLSGCSTSEEKEMQSTPNISEETVNLQAYDEQQVELHIPSDATDEDKETIRHFMPVANQYLTQLSGNYEQNFLLQDDGFSLDFRDEGKDTTFSIRNDVFMLWWNPEHDYGQKEALKLLEWKGFALSEDDLQHAFLIVSSGKERKGIVTFHGEKYAFERMPEENSLGNLYRFKGKNSSAFYLQEQMNANNSTTVTSSRSVRFEEDVSGSDLVNRIRSNQKKVDKLLWNIGWKNQYLYQNSTDNGLTTVYADAENQTFVSYSQTGGYMFEWKPEADVSEQLQAVFKHLGKYVTETELTEALAIVSGALSDSAIPYTYGEQSNSDAELIRQDYAFTDGDVGFTLYKKTKTGRFGLLW